MAQKPSITAAGAVAQKPSITAAGAVAQKPSITAAGAVAQAQGRTAAVAHGRVVAPTRRSSNPCHERDVAADNASRAGGPIKQSHPPLSIVIDVPGSPRPRGSHAPGQIAEHATACFSTSRDIPSEDYQR